MIEAPAPLPVQASVMPRGEALRRGLRANPLLVAGAVMSVLIVGAAVFAPLLAPFPADAGSATHPLAVLEVRRILLEHLREVQGTAVALERPLPR